MYRSNRILLYNDYRKHVSRTASYCPQMLMPPGLSSPSSRPTPTRQLLPASPSQTRSVATRLDQSCWPRTHLRRRPQQRSRTHMLPSRLLWTRTYTLLRCQHQHVSARSTTLRLQINYVLTRLTPRHFDASVPSSSNMTRVSSHTRWLILWIIHATQLSPKFPSYKWSSLP